MAMQSTTKPSLSRRWEDYQPSKTILFWACVAAIIATMVVGFTWGGWVTGGTSRAAATTAVILRAETWRPPYALNGSTRHPMRRHDSPSSRLYPTATRSVSSWRPAAGQPCRAKRLPTGSAFKLAPQPLRRKRTESRAFALRCCRSVSDPPRARNVSMISFVKSADPQPSGQGSRGQSLRTNPQGSGRKASEIRHRRNPPPRTPDGRRQPADLRRILVTRKPNRDISTEQGQMRKDIDSRLPRLPPRRAARQDDGRLGGPRTSATAREDAQDRGTEDRLKGRINTLVRRGL